MSSLTCPLCLAANAADAACCATCGVGLVAQCPHCDAVNERSALACRVCGWLPLLVESPATPPAEPVGGAMADELIQLIDPVEPDLPADVEPQRPGPPGAAWPDRRMPARRANDTADRLELWADPFAATVPDSTPPPLPHHVAPHAAAAHPVTAQTAKALARQAARRARMAQASAAGDATAVPRDVLVLEENAGVRDQLCDLLGGFGFRVHAAETLDQADRLLKTRPFAAAFLDIVLDGPDEGAGIELCYRIKHGAEQKSGGGAATAVVVLSAQARPADRVLAALARSDIYLAKPISRGNVARALEACGVRLPADARRG